MTESQTSEARTHRWGFGAFFLTQGIFVLASVVLSALLSGMDSGGAEFPLMFVLALILPTVIAGVVAVLVTILRGNGPRLDLRLRWNRADISTGFTIGAVGIVSTTAATMLWTEWVGPEQASSSVSGLLEGLDVPPVLAVVIFLHLWLLAPLCEELVYRGLLWGAMERLRWSQITAFILSTAIFAIGHLEPERTLLLLVIAIPIGLARMLTGGLTASVIAHQVNNFLPALSFLLISQGLLPT